MRVALKKMDLNIRVQVQVLVEVLNNNNLELWAKVLYFGHIIPHNIIAHIPHM